jgi:His-Xaa-Ser system protein HxsD
MEQFLKVNKSDNKFELLIDTNIFPKDIILKAAYALLDKGYFYFKFIESNILLQFTVKEWVKIDSKVVIWNFTDSLLETLLRDKLEKDNKVIRETIVEKAINGPIDTQNFVSFDKESKNVVNQIDFDKDIDDILSEIENDPDLKIDEWEIAAILAEIEDESKKTQKPNIELNTASIANIKKQFNK